jgi:hypothetical protein
MNIHFFANGALLDQRDLTEIATTGKIGSVAHSMKFNFVERVLHYSIFSVNLVQAPRKKIGVNCLVFKINEICVN